MFGLAVLYSGPSGRAHAEPLRVMSFNIRYGTANDGENHWERRKDLVAETILAFEPDLLGTQETLDFQKEFLDRKLPGYTSLGVGREDGTQRGEMTAIFFRTERFERLEEGHFWLSESSDVAGSKSWDTSLTRMCSWVKLRDRRSQKARPILFMNTHFDHRGAQARIESARLIRRQAKELGAGCDVILTGDFNAAVASEPYQILFAADTGPPRFVDTYAVANPESHASEEATFNGFRGLVTEGARIDWIAICGEWRIHSASIDRTERNGKTPSDHYPVTVVIE